MKSFNSKKTGLFRITAADREKLQTLLFKRYPHREWGTFFRFGYAEGWITGASAMPHQRFQFDLGMPLLGVVPADKPRKQECSCNWTKGWGDQARAERSVSK